MQMIFEQHPAGIGQRSSAIGVEVGTKLRAEAARASRAQLFVDALRCGINRVRCGHVFANRIQQMIEILVAHDLGLNCFCSIRRERCSDTATVMDDTPNARAISGLLNPSKTVA
jgi:hypothetical protein